MSTLLQIGRQIRNLRKDTKMTQADLAEASGLSDNYIALLERGKRSPSIEALENIAKALKIPINKLFLFSKGNINVSQKDLIKQLLKSVENKSADELVFLMDISNNLKSFDIRHK